MIVTADASTPASVAKMFLMEFSTVKNNSSEMGNMMCTWTAGVSTGVVCGMVLGALVVVEVVEVVAVI